MVVNRLLKWAIICILSVCTISVHAIKNSECEELVADIINPDCQKTRLAGMWQAIPGQLIPPALINQFQVDAIRLKVPSYWPEELVNVDSNYPSGLITLWTDIKLSGPNASGEGLAIWPGRQSSAVRMYVDNGRGAWVKAYDNLSVFVAESEYPIYTLPAAGTVGLLNSGPPFQLPKLYAGSRVILQLYVNDYKTGSIAQPPQIGLSGQLHRDIMHRLFWHMLFLGACLLVAIFSASHAYFSSRRRKLHIFFILMSLGASVRLIATSSLLAYLFPSLTMDHYLYIAWISFLGMLGIIIGSQVFMLPMIFKRYTLLRKVFLFLSVVPIGLIIITPILNLHEFLLASHALRVFYIVFAGLYLVFLIWQVWLKPKGQWLQACGIVAIFASASYDASLYMQNIAPYIESFAVVIFIFITSQALYFGWEHMRLLERAHALTLSLKNLNGSLEEQVRHRTRDLQSANTRLSHAATTDVLTALPNRRAFDTEIENKTLKATKSNQKFCLAIVDVDWFKSVNDRFGHDIGDKVLQALAVYLRKQLRTTDFVARIGGEEFAIVLPSVDIASIHFLLNELCTGVTKLRVDGATEYCPSISIGFAQWHNDLSVAELYKLSDQALYQAKNTGRGQVIAS